MLLGGLGQLQRAAGRGEFGQLQRSGWLAAQSAQLAPINCGFRFVGSFGIAAIKSSAQRVNLLGHATAGNLGGALSRLWSEALRLVGEKRPQKKRLAARYQLALLRSQNTHGLAPPQPPPAH